MNGAKNILIFAVGAIVGGIITWEYAKRTYERIIHDEVTTAKKKAQDAINLYKKNLEDKIDDFVKTTSKKSDNKDEDAKPPIEPVEKEESEEIISEDYPEDDEDPYYSSYLQELEYVSKNVSGKAPYLIRKEELDEDMDRSVIELTFYSDNILADDANQIVKDIDDIVGPEALRGFLNECINEVYVRNERLGCDFIILRDLRKYADCRDKWTTGGLND